MEGRVVLVTGGAKRVGRAIALELARRGADVAVHYRASYKEAASTVREIRALGVRAVAVRADLARASEAKALPRKAAEALGRLDGLVASASVYRRVKPEDFSEEEWDFHLDVNLKATYLLAIESRRRFPGGRGAMVFVGDVMGLRPYKDLVSYGVSKAGVIFLAQALAKAWAPKVRVNCVCPGPVLPPEGATKKEVEAVERATPLGYGAPEDVARAVSFFFENEYTTGSVLAVDGGRHIA